jgi:hypothetical protein
MTMDAILATISSMAGEQLCWYGASLGGSLCNTSKMYVH